MNGAALRCGPEVAAYEIEVPSENAPAHFAETLQIVPFRVKIDIGVNRDRLERLQSDATIGEIDTRTHIRRSVAAAAADRHRAVEIQPLGVTAFAQASVNGMAIIEQLLDKHILSSQFYRYCLSTNSTIIARVYRGVHLIFAQHGPN